MCQKDQITLRMPRAGAAGRRGSRRHSCESVLMADRSGHDQLMTVVPATSKRWGARCSSPPKIDTSFVLLRALAGSMFTSAHTRALLFILEEYNGRQRD